jgi:Glycosyl hydrolases family 16
VKLSTAVRPRTLFIQTLIATTYLDPSFDTVIMRSSVPFVAALAVLAAPAAAQTYTDCNPLNSTCPPDPALGTSFNQSYSTESSFDPGLWNFTAGAPDFTDSGASFAIIRSGDSVTAQTSFYIFFGRVEVWMQAASGTGIISSLVLLSDDLDEIDWEIMGGNRTYGENNYYGKGNQSERNAQYYPFANPQTGFHNYTLDWTADKLEWHLDGQVIRTLTPDDAAGGYPQTPSFFKMGIWAGGDPKEPPGVQAWAGGVTDYSQGPFIMTIANVTITDYTKNASSYSYGDKSGTWQSIKVDK